MTLLAGKGKEGKERAIHETPTHGVEIFVAGPVARKRGLPGVKVLTPSVLIVYI